jgi:hypothetical protein
VGGQGDDVIAREHGLLCGTLGHAGRRCAHAPAVSHHDHVARAHTIVAPLSVPQQWQCLAVRASLVDEPPSLPAFPQRADRTLTSGDRHDRQRVGSVCEGRLACLGMDVLPVLVCAFPERRALALSCLRQTLTGLRPQECFVLPATRCQLPPQIDRRARHRFPHAQRPRLLVLHHNHGMLPLLPHSPRPVRIPTPRRP